MYNYIIKAISRRYDKSISFLEEVMSRIVWHESKGAVDCYQIGGGPGRGLFQFEEGKAQGGETAMRRLIRLLDTLNTEQPDWAVIGGNGVNAAELTAEAQKLMFLGNVRYHPKASFKGLTIDNLPEWWADYHWAGDASHREGHIKSFNHSMEDFKG